MRYILFISCYIFTLSAWAITANSALHAHFEQLSSRLLNQLQAQQLDQQTLIETRHYHYIEGVGGVMIFEYHMSLNDWFSEQGNADTLSNINKSTLDAQNINQEKDAFNRVRAQAKQMSHQIYSLERKIKSLEKSLHSTGDPEEAQRQIALSKAELNQLADNKRQVKIKYDNAKKALTVLEDNSANLTVQYLAQVNTQLYDLVCLNSDLLGTLTQHSSESLSVILKQAGPARDQGLQHNVYQDIVYRISSHALTNCQQKEVKEKMFIRQLNRHYF